MAKLFKIDSNVTGLRIAEEESPGVLPATPVWEPMEPNSYADFGASLKTQARTPISQNRQRKKGVVVDLEASGGFTTDVTQTNIQNQLQGFMFADFRRKAERSDIDDVASGDKSYNKATGTFVGIPVGALIKASGFTTPSNNGLKTVATVAANKLTVVETVFTEVAPNESKIVQVGFKSDAGDIDVDASQDLPAITSVSLDFTTLGLIPGEWVYLGGDAAGTHFTNDVNNGFKRVKSITANRMVFDKTLTTMVTEANATGTIHIYYGRLLRNEEGGLVKRRTYQMERTLGAPETTTPNAIQAEYLVNCVANELVLNVNTADKLTADLMYMAADHEVREGTEGLKAGLRPSIVESDAFNTSSDFAFVKMSVDDPTLANSLPLFAYITEAALTISNGITPSKAIGVIGSIDLSAGNFNASGTMTAYFSDVRAIKAMRNNETVSVSFGLVKSNAGMVFDLPVLALGEGRAKVEQDQAITLPLGFDAGYNSLGYTMMMVFFDYLPTVAG